MPSRSRIVLLYSARLRRRGATRPASGLIARSCRREFGFQPARDRRNGFRRPAAAVPGGGICPVSSFSTTFSQISRSSSNVFAVRSVCQIHIAGLDGGVVALAQLFWTNAKTSGDPAACNGNSAAAGNGKDSSDGAHQKISLPPRAGF